MKSKIEFKFVLLAAATFLIVNLQYLQAGPDISLLKSKYSSWGIAPENTRSSINLPQVWKQLEVKRRVVVAVIDTGIEVDHPFLAKNIYIPKGRVSKNNFGVDFSNKLRRHHRPSDEHGHGTHIAGIIKSVFPQVKILVLKYFSRNSSGQDTLNATIGALKYAVNAGVDIINYSSNGPEASPQERQAIERAARRGILVVAAAGNENANIDQPAYASYPASYKMNNLISVTAHDQGTQVLSSSNYGKKTVDIAAPGYRIRSALPGHTSGYLTGTSQATAFVTGVAALLKAQYPQLRAQDLKKIILRSARREAGLISKCRSGGRVNAYGAYQLAANYVVGGSSGSSGAGPSGRIRHLKVAPTTTAPLPTKKIKFRKIAN